VLDGEIDLQVAMGLIVLRPVNELRGLNDSVSSICSAVGLRYFMSGPVD